MKTTLVWFRDDLRLADNPALAMAAARGAVVPVFIQSTEREDAWKPGAASRWWLHHSLASLAASLDELGSRLVLGRGSPLEVLKSMAQTTSADAIFWNRRYEPSLVQVDESVARGLRDAKLEPRSFHGRLLHEPWQVETKQGTPYQVFSPFHRRVEAMPKPDPPLAAPESLTSPPTWPRSDALDALELLSTMRWDATLAEAWKPGEAGAREVLERFLADALSDYRRDRDHPAVAGTSRLSPYLHHGELSPRQIDHSVRTLMREDVDEARDEEARAYLRQLMWREFAYHLLHHFPTTPERPLRAKYERFPWTDVETLEGRRQLEAWQRGQTGYPIVDAGMRELWQTGFMHNRVRMIAASFLVKDLLVSWREGARWFWDTLVDADLANNTLGWQWAAGCGADAAPYFRVFNPVLQGEKFDRRGEYVRRWCPELSALPDAHVHKPWDAPASVLRQANVTLGDTYPRPLVDHKEARERALVALASIRAD